MYAELIRLPIASGMSREEAVQDAMSTVPHWQNQPDLIRKHFLRGEDGCLYGVYLWKDAAAARQAHDAQWQARAAQRVGAAPEITGCDVMIILDNAAGTVEQFEQDVGFIRKDASTA